MSEKEKQARSSQASEQASGGLSLGEFAMSAVRATETQQASEISGRLWKALSWLVLVGLFVAGTVWWLRQGRDLFWQPTPADQGFLVKLKEAKSAQQGIAADFGFDGRNTLKFEISPQINLDAQADQMRLRQAIRELVVLFSLYRPNEEVKVNGYQSDRRMAEGRLRESREPGSGGAPSIWVHIEGEKMGLQEGGSFE